MDDAFFVGRFERLGDLRRQDYSVFEGNRTAGDAVGECLAVDELEDEHLLTIDLFQPVDRADVRVVQRRQHLRFAPEAREPFGSMGEAVRQRFQRDVTTQPCVSGPIDLSHTAGTERRQDFVRTEARTRGERHLARGDCNPPRSSLPVACSGGGNGFEVGPAAGRSRAHSLIRCRSTSTTTAGSWSALCSTANPWRPKIAAHSLALHDRRSDRRR